MAPITTGVELTFRPTEAMITATARIHALGPLNSMLFLIERSVVSVSMWSFKFSVSQISVVRFCIKPIIKSLIEVKYIQYRSYIQYRG